jgi:biopolymer transport protein TolR
MAASVQPPARPGGGRRGRARRHTPMHEINVTPFVDVMLVLLIVFMVTAPLLAVGIPIDLPRTEAKVLPSTPRPPLVVTVDENGRVFLQETEIALDDLLPKLVAVNARAEQDTIFVYMRGDRKIPGYDVVMKVLARLNVAGFTKLAFVTEPEDRPKRK